MNTKLLLLGGAVLAGLYLLLHKTTAAPRAVAAGYGAQTVTNPVNATPLLTQFSWKQAVTDLPSLLDAGGALFTPRAGGGAPSYADNSSLDPGLGGYYTVGADANQGLA